MIPDSVTEKDSCKAEQKRRRRLAGIVILALLVLVYSIFWYIMSGHIQERVSTRLQLSEQYGIMASCDNLHKTGYPLRIAMACDQLTWRRQAAGIGFTSGRFVAGAPVYAPHWISLDITAPVTLELPGIKPLEGRWNKMRLDMDMDNHRPDTIALAVDRLLIGDQTASGFVKPVTADFIRLDANNRNDMLTLRLSLDKLVLPLVIAATDQKIAAPEMPAMDGVVDVTFDKADRFYMPVDSPLINRFRGHEGTLSKAFLTIENGGKLTVSGPFSISEEGLLSGRFTLAFGDVGAFIRTIRTLFPEQASNLETLLFALNSMPKNEKGEPVLVFDVHHGKVRIGFIKLGTIPPLGQDQ